VVKENLSPSNPAIAAPAHRIDMPTRSLCLMFLAVMSSILAALLFVSPVIGLADQGDYRRIMSAFNIEYPSSIPKADRYFCYIQTKYMIAPQRKAGGGRMPYFSSELAFVACAVALHSMLFPSAAFDIRILACAHAIAFLGAIGLILYAGRTLSIALKTILGSLIILVFGDVGYLAYFNSFFSEPASFIFGLAYIGCTLLLIQFSRRTLWGLSIFTASAGLFVTAKTQNAPLAVVMASFIWFCMGRLEPARRSWSRACIASACTLLSLAAASYHRATETRRVGLYNFIFAELLKHSPDPEADLRELGLSPRLSRYAGTHSWDPQAYRASQLFPDGAGTVRILGFYLLHPRRLWDLMERGAAVSLSNRYPDLGNFERSLGRPCRSLAASFCIWDTVRRRLNKFPLLAFFVCANTVLPALVSKSRAGPLKPLLQFHSALGTMAALSFLIAIFGDGNETQKHLFLFNFLYDCCLIGALLWLCSGVARGLGSARELFHSVLQGIK
jgi:hypothetical protein